MVLTCGICQHRADGTDCYGCDKHNMRCCQCHSSLENRRSSFRAASPASSIGSAHSGASVPPRTRKLWPTNSFDNSGNSDADKQGWVKSWQEDSVGTQWFPEYWTERKLGDKTRCNSLGGRLEAERSRLLRDRTSTSPKEMMLDEHDIDEPELIQPLYPEPRLAYVHSTSSLVDLLTPVSQGSLLGQQEASNGPHDKPEVPTHLLSVESKNEKGLLQPSSQQLMPEIKPEMSKPHRPVDTSTNTGTYSCTYSSCSLRFDSTTMLQKHRREGHKYHSLAISTGQSARKSQAGSYRCERINPSTGKPCNKTFSRPYDLTRHEDTIHNSRKQKVRCHFCTEEKTFLRNDALTRHMRVVHLNVDWVGKQKRESQASEHS